MDCIAPMKSVSKLDAVQKGLFSHYYFLFLFIFSDDTFSVLAMNVPGLLAPLEQGGVNGHGHDAEQEDEEDAQNG